jgi:type I restriction enzyme S subunit
MVNTTNQGIMTLLGEHILTQKGFAFKSQWYSDCGTPIVKVSDLTDDSIDTSNLTCIPYDIAINYTKYELQTGDTIIQTVGSWPNNPKSVVGKVIKVPSKASGILLNQNAVKIIPTKTLDKAFVFYLLKSNIFKNFIIGCAQGAANQASITLDDIRNFSFWLPPLPIQRNIAAILSAYDDLIENNTQRIKILKEMAQALYHEWFMRFRFPGYERVRMVESDIGMVPERWIFSSLDQMFPNKNGIVLTGPFGSKLHASDYRDKGVPIILVKHVKDGNLIEEDLPLVGKHKLSELDRYRLHIGDIVVTRVGFVGETAYIHPRYQDWLFSGQMLRVRIPTIDIIHPRYLAQYYLTPEFKKNIENFAVGATRLSLNTEILSSMSVLVPPINFQLEFANFVKPIDSIVQNLQQKNANLRRTRDLLLPKLISGEVDVEKIEIQMPDSGGA